MGNKKKRRCRPRAFDRTIRFSRRNNTNTNTNTNTNERTNHMTKLYAVLVGSLLLAGGSSAMARPDADDTLTQIHRLPNEIIGAAELKPVFRFGRRLQDGVSTLSGVQDDVLHADAGKNKDG